MSKRWDFKREQQTESHMGRFVARAISPLDIRMGYILRWVVGVGWYLLNTPQATWGRSVSISIHQLARLAHNLRSL